MYRRVHLIRVVLLILIVFLSRFFLAEAQDNDSVNDLQKAEEFFTGAKGSESEAAPVKEYEAMFETPDTNFTYEKYAQFLMKVSDTGKYVLLPLNEFRKWHDTGKIVIGLRHDVDNDLSKAKLFSVTEKNSGVRSTYYILHTADYYLANPANKAVHTTNILPVLKDMQDNGGFEIGWHNDLVTLQIVYNIDPVTFLKQELEWLRSNGLRVTGSASHGSSYCKVYWYLNFYFFQECTYPAVGQYVNNVVIPSGSSSIPIRKGKMSDFGLDYEAYFLGNNKYYSDASIVNGKRWDIGMLDLSSLKAGDRVIILLHPIHWHQASVLSDIKSFSFEGVKSTTINALDATVNVVMPYGTDRSRLIPNFSLSPGAYAKVSGAMQTSNVSSQNFTLPVTYTVYAENRSITRDWAVNVENARNSACEFESFRIPGYTKRVMIDRSKKTVTVRVYSWTKLGSLTPHFKLSEGATAWIGSSQQFSDNGIIDFSSPVTYKIVAEDGVTTSQWKVSVELLNTKADFVSFVVPGMARPAIIDTAKKAVSVEIKPGEPLNELPVLFELSSYARAFVAGTEQISGLSLASFTQPVIYRVISEDSLTINNWTVTASYSALAEESMVSPLPSVRIYPNPVSGKAIIELQNISEPESRIEIFNTLGRPVYTSVVRNMESYSEELDLSGFSPGIYFIKCSSVKDPVSFIIARH